MELLDKLATAQAEIAALMAEAEEQGFQLEAHLDSGASPPSCQLVLVRRIFAPFLIPEAANN